MDRQYFKKMKMKAYHRLRQNRIDSATLLLGKADSELKTHSQEMLEDSKTDTHLHYNTAKRYFNDKQHSSETNIMARISNK